MHLEMRGLNCGLLSAFSITNFEMRLPIFCGKKCKFLRINEDLLKNNKNILTFTIITAIFDSAGQEMVAMLY